MNICVHVSLYEYVPMCMDMCVCLNEHVYMYMTMYVVCKVTITWSPPWPLPQVGQAACLHPHHPRSQSPLPAWEQCPAEALPSCILGGATPASAGQRCGQYPQDRPAWADSSKRLSHQVTLSPRSSSPRPSPLLCALPNPSTAHLKALFVSNLYSFTGI